MKLTGPAVGQGDTMSQEETKAGSELSGGLDHPRGIAAALEDPGQPSAPDLFEELEGYYHFPCGMCSHRGDPPEFCQKCRWWVA